MATSEREFSVKVTVDDKGSLKVFDDAARKVADLANKTQAAASNVSGAGQAFVEASLGATKLAAGFVAAGTAAVGAATAYATLAGVARAAGLNDLAQKVGVSALQLSQLELAAKTAGVGLEGLGQGLKFLARNMAEAQAGSGDAANAFRSLGVSVADSSGQLRSSGAVLADLSSKFAAMADGPAKTALSMQLLGRAGAEMIPFLNQGGAELQRLATISQQLGLVLDKGVTDAADRFSDNMDILRAAAEGAGQQVANGLIPHLASLSDAFVELVAAAGIGNGTLASFGDSIGSVLDQVTDAVATLTNRVKEVGIGQALEEALRSVGAQVVPASIEIGTTIGAELAKAAIEAASAVWQMVTWKEILAGAVAVQTGGISGLIAGGLTHEFATGIEAGFTGGAQSANFEPGKTSILGAILPIGTQAGVGLGTALVDALALFLAANLALTVAKSMGAAATAAATGFATGFMASLGPALVAAVANPAGAFAVGAASVLVAGFVTAISNELHKAPIGDVINQALEQSLTDQEGALRTLRDIRNELTQGGVYTQLARPEDQAALDAVTQAMHNIASGTHQAAQEAGQATSAFDDMNATLAEAGSVAQSAGSQLDVFARIVKSLNADVANFEFDTTQYEKVIAGVQSLKAAERNIGVNQLTDKLAGDPANAGVAREQLQAIAERYVTTKQRAEEAREAATSFGKATASAASEGATRVKALADEASKLSVVGGIWADATKGAITYAEAQVRVAAASKDAGLSAQALANARQALVNTIKESTAKLQSETAAIQAGNDAFQAAIDAGVGLAEATELASQASADYATNKLLEAAADKEAAEAKRKAIEENRAALEVQKASRANAQVNADLGNLRAELALRQQVAQGLITQGAAQRAISVEQEKQRLIQQGFKGDVAATAEEFVKTREQIEESQKGLLNLGDTIRDAFSQTFDAVISGTRDLGEVWEGLGLSFAKSLFDATLEKKFSFDKTFQANILDLGGMVESILGGSFSNVFGGAGQQSGGFVQSILSLFGGGGGGGGFNTQSADSFVGPLLQNGFQGTTGAAGGSSLVSLLNLLTTGAGGFGAGAANGQALLGLVGSNILSGLGKYVISNAGQTAIAGLIGENGAGLIGDLFANGAALGSYFGGGAISGAVGSAVGNVAGDTVGQVAGAGANAALTYALALAGKELAGGVGVRGPQTTEGQIFQVIGDVIAQYFGGALAVGLNQVLAPLVGGELFGIGRPKGKGTRIRQFTQQAFQDIPSYQQFEETTGLRFRREDYSAASEDVARARRSLTKDDIAQARGFAAVFGAQLFQRDDGTFTSDARVAGSIDETANMMIAALAKLEGTTKERSAGIRSLMRNMFADMGIDAREAFGGINRAADAGLGEVGEVARGVAGVFETDLPKGVNLSQLALQNLFKDGQHPGGSGGYHENDAFVNYDKTQRDTFRLIANDAELFDRTFGEFSRRGFRIDTATLDSQLKAVVESAKAVGGAIGEIFSGPTAQQGVASLVANVRSSLVSQAQTVVTDQILEKTDIASSFEEAFALIQNADTRDLLDPNNMARFGEQLQAAIGEGQQRLLEYIPLIEEVRKAFRQAFEADTIEATRARLAQYTEQARASLADLSQNAFSAGVTSGSPAGTKKAFVGGVEGILNQTASASVTSLLGADGGPLSRLLGEWQEKWSQATKDGVVTAQEQLDLSNLRALILAVAEDYGRRLQDVTEVAAKTAGTDLSAELEAAGEVWRGAVGSGVGAAINVLFEGGSVDKAVTAFSETMRKTVAGSITQAVAEGFVNSLVFESPEFQQKFAAVKSLAADYWKDGVLDGTESADLSARMKDLGQTVTTGIQASEGPLRAFFASMGEEIWTGFESKASKSPSAAQLNGGVPAAATGGTFSGSAVVGEAGYPELVTAIPGGFRVVPLSHAQAAALMRGGVSGLAGGGDVYRYFEGLPGPDGAIRRFPRPPRVGDPGYEKGGPIYVVERNTTTGVETRAFFDGIVPSAADPVATPRITPSRGRGLGRTGPRGTPTPKPVPVYGEFESDASLGFESALSAFAGGGAIEELRESVSQTFESAVIDGLVKGLLARGPIAKALDDVTKQLNTKLEDALKDGIVSASEAEALGTFAKRGAERMTTAFEALKPVFEALGITVGDGVEKAVEEKKEKIAGALDGAVAQAFQQATGFGDFEKRVKQAMFGAVFDGIATAFAKASGVAAIASGFARNVEKALEQFDAGDITQQQFERRLQSYVDRSLGALRDPRIQQIFAAGEKFASGLREQFGLNSPIESNTQATIENTNATQALVTATTESLDLRYRLARYNAGQSAIDYLGSTAGVQLLGYNPINPTPATSAPGPTGPTAPTPTSTLGKIWNANLQAMVDDPGKTFLELGLSGPGSVAYGWHWNPSRNKYYPDLGFPNYIPGYATGGIAGLYGEEIIRVGEREPEAIIPISHLGGGGDSREVVQLMRQLVRENQEIRRELAELRAVYGDQTLNINARVDAGVLFSETVKMGRVAQKGRATVLPAATVR